MRIQWRSSLLIPGLTIAMAAELAAQRAPQRVVARVTAADTGLAINAAALPPRAAIAFRAFPRIDNAGRALNLDTTITLPNGRTITRRAFFDSADALERRFNAIGYSLRSPSDTLLSGLATSPALLTQQRARIQNIGGGKFAPLGRAELIERRSIQPRLQTADRSVIALSLPASKLPGILPVGAWKTMPATKQWGDAFDFGSSGTVRARLAYSGKIVGDTMATSLAASGTLDGWLLGGHKTLLQVTSSASAPVNNANGHAAFDVSALGKSVYSKTATTSTFAIADTFSVPLDYHVDGHWAIGPIPISLTLGTRGDASVSYELSASPGAVLGGVTPAVDLQGYGDADIDILLASAGVGIELTFIKSSLPITGQIAIVNNPKVALFGLKREFHADLDLDALSGNINLHAKVYYPCFGICSKKYKKTIFDWDGFSVNKNLITFQDFWSFRAAPVIAVSNP